MVKTRFSSISLVFLRFFFIQFLLQLLKKFKFKKIKCCYQAPKAFQGLSENRAFFSKVFDVKLLGITRDINKTKINKCLCDTNNLFVRLEAKIMMVYTSKKKSINKN